MQRNENTKYSNEFIKILSRRGFSACFFLLRFDFGVSYSDIGGDDWLAMWVCSTMENMCVVRNACWIGF